jgi:hypothetical protein
VLGRRPFDKDHSRLLEPGDRLKIPTNKNSITANDGIPVNVPSLSRNATQRRGDTLHRARKEVPRILEYCTFFAWKICVITLQQIFALKRGSYNKGTSYGTDFKDSGRLSGVYSMTESRVTQKER